MADTFTQLRAHLVWSTKSRQPLIDDSLEPQVFEYIGGLVRRRRHVLVCAGGMPDHIHLLIAFHPQQSISDLVRDIKSNSAIWIHDKVPTRKRFAWQAGYGAFSVSKSAEEKVVNYIRNQKIHHATQSFEDEYVALLSRHGVAFNEQYLWN